MTYVVDAGVAIKWFVPEPLQDRAQSLLYAEGGQLEAPDFLIAEVANIAWKKAMRQEITASQAKSSRTRPATHSRFVTPLWS